VINSAQTTLVDVGFERLHVGALAVVEGDVERTPGPRCRGDHRFSIGERAGEWLLAKHVLAAFHRRNRDRRVQEVGRADVDDVQVIAGHKWLVIGVKIGDVVRRAEFLEPLRIGIRHGNNLDAGNLLVSAQVMPSNAQADDAHAQCI